MKEVFVNHMINYLKRNNACSKEQENIFRYTLESLYSFCTKSLVILLISLALNTFKITLVTLLLYSILRGFTFGIHATKNLYCWIISLTTYIFVPLIVKYCTLPIQVLYISYIIGFLSLLLWAPADTKARPLINKRKRNVNKLLAIFYILILYVLSINLNNYNFKEILAFILIINFICICPLTYYLFKQPYRNYKNFKKNSN